MSPDEQTARPGGIETRQQVSAGGVAFRQGTDGLEVALVCVPPRSRWQLPKGLVDPAETPEATAVREVQEEAGLETELLAFKSEKKVVEKARRLIAAL